MSDENRRPRKRDRLRGYLGLPVRSAAPQITTVQPAQVSAPPPISSIPAPSTTAERFLESVLSKLSTEEKETICAHLAPDTRGIVAAVRDAHHSALGQKKVCESKRWKWTFRDTEIVLRDEAEKVLLWLDRFKSVGDVVANVDPLHVGLPWAGIRMLLEMTVTESHQMASLLTGMNLTLATGNRLEVYFEYYQRLPAMLARDNFENALVEMYAYVLKFLAKAIQTYQKSVAGRAWRAVWDVSHLEDFEQQCDKLAARVAFEVDACERELVAQDREDAVQWKVDLDRNLVKLDEIRHLKGSLNALHVKVDLSKLKTAAGATYNSYEDDHTAQCLEGTRTDLLNQISEWADSHRGKSIFWLCGMAGTGKSTIARTVADRLDKRGALGASFFFKRGGGDQGIAKRFFPTIVRQLVDAVPGSSESVAQALESDSLLCERNLQEQFEKLLLQPFTTTTSGHLRSDGLVIVIDALDECERRDDVRTILKLLSQVDALGPVRLRVFVTSRPELPIQIGFRSMNGDLHEDVVLEEVQTSTIQHDIRVFFEQKFMDIRSERTVKRPYDALPTDWPNELDVQRLVDLAVPLFIFASTICRFISERNPQKRLTLILEQSESHAYSGLGKTYLPILEQMIAEKDEEQQHEITAEFKKIVGSIVLLADPLSVVSLSHLLRIDQEVIHDHLEQLHSVLNIPPDPHHPIRLLHLSFRDFLVDPSRKDRDIFWIDRTLTQKELADRCLQLLSQPKVLRRDICNVGEPGKRRTKVSWQRVTSHIPPDVAYACQFWIWHMLESKEELHDDGPVLIFLQEHFLHWLEAITWLGQLSTMIQSISELQSQVKGLETARFLQDALRFLLQNRYTFDLAPLQMYDFAIVFMPVESALHPLFGQEPSESFELLPSPPSDWNADLLKLEGHKDWVTSVTFSPDGQTLASSSNDKTVRLWNARTGEEKLRISVPDFCGHAYSAFSEDGQQLVAVTHDHEWPDHLTMQQWNSQTGELVQVLGGTYKWPAAVAFSPRGRIVAIANASWNVKLFDIRKWSYLRSLEGHMGKVSALAFSPNGKILATGSDDACIRLWDLSSGMQTQQLRGFDMSVSTLAFSSDGQILTSALYGENVRAWNIHTGQQTMSVKRIGWEGQVSAMTLSPADQVVAVALEDSVVQIRDVRTGQTIQKLTGHLDTVYDLVFSHDGRAIVSASHDGTVRLWNAQTGEELQKIEVKAKRDRVPTGLVASIALSPDTNIMALALKSDMVQLWNTQTGEQLQHSINHPSVLAMAFAPDGAVIATVSMDDTTRFWRVLTGEPIYGLERDVEEISATALSPNGRYIATGSNGGTVKLWGIPKGEQMKRFIGHRDKIIAIAISPDEQLIALGTSYSENAIRLCSAQSGMCILEFEMHQVDLHAFTNVGNLYDRTMDQVLITSMAMAFSPDGQLLAVSVDQTVRLRNANTGHQTHILIGHDSDISTVVFSSDGKMIATASEDQTVRLWDAATGEQALTLVRYPLTVHAVAFSPDNRVLAVASGDTVWLRDIQRSRKSLKSEGRKASVTALEFSPDSGLVVSGAADGRIQLWDAQTGRVLRMELEGHTDSITTLALSPDSLTLVSTSHDRILRLWDVCTGRSMQLGLKDPDVYFDTAVFSPDGQTFASALDDRTVRLWDAQSGKLKLKFVRPVCVEMLALRFSQDNRLLAAAYRIKTETGGHMVQGCLWDARTGEQTLGFKHPGNCPAALFSPDCQTMALAEGTALYLRDINTGEEMRVLDLDSHLTTRMIYAGINVPFTSFSKDGKYVFTHLGTFLLDWTAFNSPGKTLERTTDPEVYGRWIRYRGRNVLHLPRDYQGLSFGICRNTLIMGHVSGNVTFFRLKEPSM